MKSFLFGSFSALLLAAAIAPVAHAQTTTTPDAPRTNAPTDSGLTVPEQLQQQQQTPQGQGGQPSNTGDRTPNAPRTNAPTDSGLTVPEQLQQQQQTPQGNQPSNMLENRTPNAPRTNAPTDSGLTVPEQLQQQQQAPQGGSSTQYRQEQQQRGTQQQQYNSPNRQTPNNTDGSVRTAPQTTNQGTGASGSGQYVPGLW